MEVNGGIIWTLVGHRHHDKVVLIDSDLGPGRLVVDEQHLSRVAVRGMVLPRDCELVLLPLAGVRRLIVVMMTSVMASVASLAMPSASVVATARRSSHGPQQGQCNEQSSKRGEHGQDQTNLTPKKVTGRKGRLAVEDNGFVNFVERRR